MRTAEVKREEKRTTGKTDGAARTACRLGKLGALKKEVDHLSQRIGEMRMAAEGGSARITGMPMGGRIKNVTAEYAGKIADMEEILEDRRRKCLDELAELYRFIDDVADSEVRSILRYRYVEGKTWAQVAMRMGYSGEQIPRKMHNAYLERRMEAETDGSEKILP